MVATGDRLRAILVRQADPAEASTWTRIDLEGAPARLADDGQVDLTAARLTVLPDLSGEPGRFIARGATPHAPKMLFRQRGETHRFESVGPVHVVRLRRQHGLLVQGFGVPMSAIPPQFDQLIEFAGHTRVQSERDGLQMIASEGLTMLRSEAEELRDTLFVQGHGTVEIAADGIRARGGKGFTLEQTAPASLGGRTGGNLARATVRRRIWIGPRRLDPTHRYELDRDQPATGAGTRRRFRLAGSGTCRIEMRGREIDRLELSSRAEDIEVTSDLGDHISRLASVRASLSSHGGSSNFGIREFHGRGRKCQLAITTKHGKISGVAPEIKQLAPGFWVLLSAGETVPLLRHVERGFLRGRRIEVERLSAEDFRLRATRPAHLHTEDVKPNGSTVVDLRAHEIRIEPFMLSPEVARIYENLLPAMPHLGLDTRYLFADGDVDLQVTSGTPSTLHRGTGRGHRLVMRADRVGRAFLDGEISGRPARFDSRDRSGRHVRAEAERVTFFGERSAQFLTLFPTADTRPKVTLFGDLGEISRPKGNGPSRTHDSGMEPATLQRTELICAQKIAVKPRQIVFGGPVSVRGFDTEGHRDPTGLYLDANALTMDRRPSGEIEKVRAEGDIDFRWSGVRGRCDTLTIDLTRTSIRALGTARPAVIQLPDEVVTVRHLKYNYRTKMVECWRTHFDRVLTAK